MAQILSSTKVTERPQKNGMRYIRYKFRVQANDLSEIDYYLGPTLVASDFDDVAYIPTAEQKVLNRLAIAEHEQLYSMASIADPLQAVLNPVWSTTKEMAKAAIYWMLREREPRIVIYLEPLIEYIQANYNATQIGNLLDLSAENVQRINRRVNAETGEV